MQSGSTNGADPRSGERGIRTLDTRFHVCRFSKPVPSASRPSLPRGLQVRPATNLIQLCCLHLDLSDHAAIRALPQRYFLGTSLETASIRNQRPVARPAKTSFARTYDR